MPLLSEDCIHRARTALRARGARLLTTRTPPAHAHTIAISLQERFKYVKAGVGLHGAPARRPLSAPYTARCSAAESAAQQRMLALPGGQRFAAAHSFEQRLAAARRAGEAREDADKVRRRTRAWGKGACRPGPGGPAVCSSV